MSGGWAMLHRRDAMLRLGQLGLGALTLPGLLQAQTTARGSGRARSCILLYLWGGPPQQDMWDMKPDAPQGIRSHRHTGTCGKWATTYVSSAFQSLQSVVYTKDG